MKKAMWKRLFERTRINLDPGACWMWSRPRKDGYGDLRDPKKLSKKVLAHRAMFELFNGPIPEGLGVLHKCDNPGCVNPEHLFLGTHTDNMQDMAAKGRTGIRRGEDQPGTTLTEAKVREIRRRHAGGESQDSLAKVFGVGQSSISRICLRLKWAHVDD